MIVDDARQRRLHSVWREECGHNSIAAISQPKMEMRRVDDVTFGSPMVSTPDDTGRRMLATERAKRRPLETLGVPLDRDVFLRTLLRELAGTLQDIVGLEDASGFVSVVGQNMGRRIDDEYRKALGVTRLSPDQVADVLVDLKARINGDFQVIEKDDDRIVLGNRACPFGDKVHGRPALCMMTSNVFGSIAAENLGYAKVELGETIANGFPGCRVIIHLHPTAAAESAPGREYFGGESFQYGTEGALPNEAA